MSTPQHSGPLLFSLPVGKANLTGRRLPLYILCMDYLRLAIKQVGGAAALGRHLGITRQAVEDWDRVPAKHCLTVERLTGISRYQLRPDIYGEAPRHAGNELAVA